MSGGIRIKGLSALMTVLLLTSLYAVGSPAPAFAETAAAPTLPSRVSDGLAVLSQSVEDTGLTLIWSKPEHYEEIRDYNIYRDGVKIGNACSNANSPAQKFFNRFYADESNADAVKIGMHNYVVTGLAPGTSYTFTVKAVDESGNEIGEGRSVGVTTKAAPAVVDVTAAPYRAVGNGTTVNTAAIQSAIDDCPAGGEVLIPSGGTFMTGALYLKGNMTFRVDGTLLSSSSADDLLAGSSLVVSGSLQRRFPGTVNIIGTSGAPLSNVRLTGTGTIDGNGWLYQAANPNDLEYGNGDLTESAPTGRDSIAANGILAKNEYQKALQVYKDFHTASGTTYTQDDAESYAYGARSCMINGAYVTNLYIGDGLTVTNPANHTVYITRVRNYVVNGLIAQSYNINNGDGINVSRFNGLTVVNSVINTGDDNVAMNGGAVGDPAVGSAWIFNNYMQRGHGGVTFGSGTCSWVDNVMAEDNVMVQTANGLRLKSKPSAGGGVRFVTFRDTAMKHMTNTYGSPVPITNWDGYGFTFTTNYPGVTGNADWPVFHDINISNVSVDGARTIHNDGTHDGSSNFAPNYNINFNHVAFSNATELPIISYLRDSTFQNVTFADSEGWEGATLSNCQGLSFVTLLTKDDGITVLRDVTSTGSVAGDIVGSNTGEISYCVVRQAAHGDVTFRTDGAYVYTPNPGFTGSDRFDYKVSNHTATSSLPQDSNISTVSITVLAQAAVPDASDQSIVTNRNTAVSGMLSATGNAGGELTYSRASDPRHGSVLVEADGSFLYTPAANFHGTDSFTFSAANSVGTSAPATVTITVNEKISATSFIEAESYSDMSGIQTEACSEGGQDVGFIDSGDYLGFDAVEFGSGVNSFEARVASNTSGGNIEIRLDSPTGTLVGTCQVPGTGGWQTYVTKSCAVGGVSGTHDLYLTFKGGSGYLLNIDRFRFRATDAYSAIEAEAYDDMSGVRTEECSEGGLDVGYIDSGDYLAFSNVDFGSGATGFTARAASNTSGGSIEIRLDSPTGTLVGTCPVAGTVGWQTYTTRSCAISGASGIHNLYLTFTGSDGYLFNLNWIKFSK